ncbi:hypothetical protein ANAPC5_01518 [Anaplasma phagocytophilum]|nr:hypothetical protein ANAPC5_01518 [Anaplasma phagocytophilum]
MAAQIQRGCGGRYVFEHKSMKRRNQKFLETRPIWSCAFSVLSPSPPLYPPPPLPSPLDQARFWTASPASYKYSHSKVKRCSRGTYIFMHTALAKHIHTASIPDRYPSVQKHGDAALWYGKDALITLRDRRNLLSTGCAFFLWHCAFVNILTCSQRQVSQFT